MTLTHFRGVNSNQGKTRVSPPVRQRPPGCLLPLLDLLCTERACHTLCWWEHMSQEQIRGIEWGCSPGWGDSHLKVEISHWKTVITCPNAMVKATLTPSFDIGLFKKYVASSQPLGSTDMQLLELLGPPQENGYPRIHHLTGTPPKHTSEQNCSCTKCSLIASTFVPGPTKVTNLEAGRQRSLWFQNP